MKRESAAAKMRRLRADSRELNEVREWLKSEGAASDLSILAIMGALRRDGQELRKSLAERDAELANAIRQSNEMVEARDEAIAERDEAYRQREKARCALEDANALFTESDSPLPDRIRGLQSEIGDLRTVVCDVRLRLNEAHRCLEIVAKAIGGTCSNP